MTVPRILFETNELLVLDKPAGLIVHSDGRTIEPSVAEWVLVHYPALAGVGVPWTSPQGEVVPLPGIVHRLDRTTSGVMLIAKTNEMYAYLKKQFKERRVDKTYLAYVYGRMEEEEGEIVAEIVRSSDHPKRWVARPIDKSNKRAAITKWSMLQRTEDLQTGAPISFLEIKPETGRTHQIRVHLASIGHPIVADHLYADGCLPLLDFQRPALHADSLSLAIGGQSRTFRAELPEDFR